jgi:hypothetical protein
LLSSTKYFYRCCPALSILSLLSSSQYRYRYCPALNIFIVVQHSILLSLLSSTLYFYTFGTDINSTIHRGCIVPFVLKQWLRERASQLRYVYIVI